MGKTGSLECCPILSYDWVIEDFLEWAKATTDFTRGPKFVVRGIRFSIGCYPNKRPDTMYIWLQNHDKQPVAVANFSLHMVANDKTLLEICSKKDVAFGADSHYLDKDSLDTADARITKSKIDPKFLPNLRIRCQLELVSSQPVIDQAFPVQGSSLVDDLRREINNRRFCDLTLVCGEQHFHVHRVLLAARSSVFSTLFEQEDAKEEKPSRVVIKDISPTALESIVKFTHTDQIEEKDLNTDLLAAAKKYQVKVLFDKCEEKLSRSLTVGNVVENFIVAYVNQADKLKNICKKYIVDHFNDLKANNGMTLLVNQHPHALLEILEFACKF